jgi:hypothetical protein
MYFGSVDGVLTVISRTLSFNYIFSILGYARLYARVDWGHRTKREQTFKNKRKIKKQGFLFLFLSLPKH